MPPLRRRNPTDFGAPLVRNSDTPEPSHSCDGRRHYTDLIINPHRAQLATRCYQPRPAPNPLKSRVLLAHNVHLSLRHPDTTRPTTY
jgi:hypothetical protein